MRFVIILSMLLTLPVLAQAQSKYSAWSDPDQKSGQVNTRQLIERLDKLIDEAQKARAADPAFLRDLRDLARSYDAPASQPGIRTVLTDDFTDGDFTANPAWTVSAGRYWVERGWGLRSAVPVQDPNSQQQEPAKKTRNRDAAIAILGAILGQSGSGSSTMETTASTSQALATIYSPAAIGNAFTLDLEFSSWVKQGQRSGGSFDIGPYQGNDRAAGYRLTYSPGKGLTLAIYSARGQRVIDQQVGPLTLEDKKTHSLHWVRDDRGRMTVDVDGRRILSATDSGLNDPFQGLVLNNGGGEYIIKRITVTSGS